MCVYHLESSSSLSASGLKARNLSLQIQSKLHQAREKHRLAFSDTLMRVLTNLAMFVDVTKPRAFDAEDLNKELPAD